MSANGTWVNQTTKLTRGTRRLLNSGDEIALLNPNKQHKKPASGEGQAGAGGGTESGKESGDGERLLDAEDAIYTFINLDRHVHGEEARVCVCLRNSISWDFTRS